MNSTRDLVGAARDIVRRRFDDREELAIEILNHQCGTDSVHARAAEQVFDALESATGIPAGRLRPQDNFGSLFRVFRSELGSEWESRWATLGLGTYIEPFAYELLEVLDVGSNQGLWRKAWASLDPPPANEEQMIDEIMRLSLCEFVRFAISMRRPQDRRGAD